MANTATIKVLVDDVALDNLTKKTAATAKTIRGGFDIATGAAAVFGDKSSAAMEKLANRSIIVANTFNGIEDLLDGLKENDGFLKMAQKVGVGKDAINGLASAIPYVGIAVTALVGAFTYFSEKAKEEIASVQADLVGLANDIGTTSRAATVAVKAELEQLGDLDTLDKVDKAIQITKKGVEDLTKFRLEAVQSYNRAYLSNLKVEDQVGRASLLFQLQGEIKRLELITERTDAQETELAFLKRKEIGLKNVIQADADLTFVVGKQNQVAKIRNQLIEQEKQKTDQAAAAKKAKTQEDRDAAFKGAQAEIEAQAVKDKADAQLITNEEERNVKLFDIEKKRLDDTIDLYDKYGESIVALEAQRYALEVTEAKRRADSLNQLNEDERKKARETDKKYFEDTIASERLNEEQQLNLAKEYFLQGVISEEEYQKAITAIQEKFQKVRDTIAEKEEIKAAEQKRLQDEIVNTSVQTLNTIGNLFMEISDQKLAAIDKMYESYFDKLDREQDLALGIYAESEKDQAIIKEKFAQQRIAAEEKQAAETMKIRRRQADVQLALGIIDVAANTAQALGAVSINPAVVSDPTLITLRTILSGIILANAAVQTGVLVAQRAAVSKMARGGMLVGPSHANGGIYMGGGVEAEGGEAVINRRSSRMFGGLLSAVNQAGGGVPIMPGESIKGGINTTSTTIIDYDALASAMARNPVKAFVVTQDITLAQNQQTAIQSKATIA